MMFWLREETKDNERRTPLTPENAKKLIAQTGCTIHVGSSNERIFRDQEYRSVGCKIVPPESWRNAPEQDYILGLKELPEDNLPLPHNHIYFAHIFKGQEGAKGLFERFRSGGGKLFDLEFLMDENNRRVAAFGRWAGFVGAAMAVDRYYQKHAGTKHALPFKYFENKDLLIEYIREKQQKQNKHPKSIIIGAKGRCGSGA
ncbi:MAG: saccharopine dehydrogenase, partial [Deltaproteobacteria bacterium]